MSEETRDPDHTNANETNEAPQSEPVMDGAEEVFEGDEDPRKGQTDPALIRHPSEGDKTAKPYNL